jgi:Zn finger protein HypA/HybF involved in hydrogenase expression
MKTINALFISSIIREDSVTTAVHFDYEEARETMIHMLDIRFDLQNDDGLIFEARKEGEATPIFSYRAYLNGENEPEREVEKENKAVKIFFNCPKCHSTEGKLKVDEDSDLVMECIHCNKPTLVNA